MAASGRQARREQLERQHANWMQQQQQTLASSNRSMSLMSSKATPASHGRDRVISSASFPGLGQHEEPSDFDCPICSQIMSGANQLPIVLFPCGHTFCKSCLTHVVKQKCPFCRQPIHSQTVNIPLQAMIDKRLNVRSETQPNDAAEKYLRDYRALSMKRRTLTDTRKQIESELSQRSSEFQRLSATAASLESAHDQMVKELAQLTGRLQQIELHRDENQCALDNADRERQGHQKLLQDIDEQLRPIQVGIDKSRLLFYNFRPDSTLSSDDDN